MFDRVLDQRLNQQWRHIALLAAVFEVLPDLQLVTESHALDIEVAFRKGKLFAERDALLLAEAQRVAQEIGKSDAHLARLRRIDAGKGADGIQTVEQKVRIDLRLERLDFRFSGQDLGLLRAFEREDQIVKNNRQQINNREHACHGGDAGAKSRFDS